jgi:pimeloyl-ACP methyl ester carboxylesterase
VTTLAPREHRAGACRVLEHGDGARVFVGLHGWSGSSASFDPLAARLPVDATLFALDLPGAAGTPPPETWTTDALADRVEEALDALDLGAGSGAPGVSLVAACGSVGPALRLSARRPDLVSRLVLVDPFVFVPWYLRLFLWPVVGRFFYACAFGNPLGRRMTDGALAGRRAGPQSLTEGFGQVAHAHNLGLLRAFCEAAEQPLERQATFRGPVDVLYGERTFAAARASAERLRDVFAGARAFRIPGAGHVPMHEAPDAVADLVFAARGDLGRGGDEGSRPGRDEGWTERAAVRAAAGGRADEPAIPRPAGAK